MALIANLSDTRNMHRHLIIFCFLVKIACTTYGQALLPYQSKNYTTQQRVSDLMQRMSLREKWMQLFMVPGDLKFNESAYKDGIFGLQINAWVDALNPAQQIITYDTTTTLVSYYKQIKNIQNHFLTQTRLGIPPIFFAEALHGVVANNVSVFPQSIALAATFDTALMHQVANYIADECTALNINQVLSPVINLATDVRWGRTEETYGEDPYLTSVMGIAYVTAFERKNIITTPKHFVSNVGDGGRDSYPIDYSKRHLQEYDLVPFKKCFENGKSRSVMTSYNALNGKSCSTNKVLLQLILKNEWNFKGFVISDAGAVGGANVLLNTTSDYETSGREAIESGLDVIFQTDVNHEALFNKPFLNGQVNEAMDKAVERVLTAKFELGLFDNKQPNKILPHPTHADSLAFIAAAKSIVLLQNNGVLPLNKKQDVAVIGADATEKRMGGYSGHNNYIISILDGIRNYAQGNVVFDQGASRYNDTYNVVDAKHFIQTNGNSINAYYYNNINWQGLPQVAHEPNINHNCTFMPPAANTANSFYSVKWQAKLKAPYSGNYQIGLRGNDGYTLTINNKIHISRTQKVSFHTDMKPYYFKKDSVYNIEVTFFEPVGNGSVALVWDAFVSTPNFDKSILIAKKSDVIIYVAGINEGEFNDRASLQLPGMQAHLLQELSLLNKPIVVLLVGGSAVTMPWLHKVDAVMQVWYPGQQGGNAIAAVVYGKSPSGKLPFTWPVHEAQLPLVYNHKPTGRGNDYTNLSGKPLFPFGYGLSYTTFSYSDLIISKNVISNTDSFTVTCTITNTGAVYADEVAQLYIKDVVASYAQPVLSLKGFERISLSPGQYKKVTFNVTPEMLTILDENLKPIVEPGVFEIMIGASCTDIKLKSSIIVK